MQIDLPALLPVAERPPDVLQRRVQPVRDIRLLDGFPGLGRLQEQKVDLQKLPVRGSQVPREKARGKRDAVAVRYMIFRMDVDPHLISECL